MSEEEICSATVLQSHTPAAGIVTKAGKLSTKRKETPRNGCSHCFEGSIPPLTDRVTSAPTASSRVWFTSCPASPVGSYSYCCSSCTFSRATRTDKYRKYGGQQQNSPLLQTISRHKEVEVGWEGTEPPSCCRDSEVPFAKRAENKSHSSGTVEKMVFWAITGAKLQCQENFLFQTFYHHTEITGSLQYLDEWRNLQHLRCIRDRLATEQLKATGRPLHFRFCYILFFDYNWLVFLSFYDIRTSSERSGHDDDRVGHIPGTIPPNSCGYTVLALSSIKISFWRMSLSSSLASSLVSNSELLAWPQDSNLIKEVLNTKIVYLAS